MFDVFESYLAGRASFTDPELALMRSSAVENNVSKRELILKEGAICTHLIFVTHGLLRLFRVDEKGNEHTLRFTPENFWMSDRESYTAGKPSNFNIEAIEDTRFLSWKKPDFDHLLTEIPALKQLMKSLITRQQIASQNRLYSSISDTAEQRFLQFVKNYPGIYSRVPLHMVASYLGVSRETLTRIRSRGARK